jgi:hydroxymethylglutaryl-CoA reductase
MNSRVPGFHRLTPEGRSTLVEKELGLTPGLLSGCCRVPEDSVPASENGIGPFVLPWSIAPNFRVDGLDCFVPMVTEEASVVAAASNGARLLRSGPGIVSCVPPPIATGQIQITGIADPAERTQAGLRVVALLPSLAALTARSHPSLAAAGGGLRGIRFREAAADLVILLDVDTGKAMGANLVTALCERLAPEVQAASGGRVLLRIVSNAAENRVVTVTGRVPTSGLDPDPRRAAVLARDVEAASRFAEAAPDRAVTHNKGIFNGIDAVLIACGQDFRAVEAAGHAYAARTGTYGPLSTWRATAGGLEGSLALPLAIGTVGGAIESRSGCLASLAVLGMLESRDAARLAAIVAATGLAQNLAALLALVGEGGLGGFRALHRRSRPSCARPPSGP